MPRKVPDTFSSPWQPYYTDPLTVDDAAEMLTGAGRLLSVLTGSPSLHGVDEFSARGLCGPVGIR